jgi:hypothetical protein
MWALINASPSPLFRKYTNFGDAAVITCFPQARYVCESEECRLVNSATRMYGRNLTLYAHPIHGSNAVRLQKREQDIVRILFMALLHMCAGFLYRFARR